MRLVRKMVALGLTMALSFVIVSSGVVNASAATATVQGSTSKKGDMACQEFYTYLESNVLVSVSVIIDADPVKYLDLSPIPINISAANVYAEWEARQTGELAIASSLPATSFGKNGSDTNVMAKSKINPAQKKTGASIKRSDWKAFSSKYTASAKLYY